MAIEFTHENGTGLASSTSFISEGEADQYFENTGRKTEWKAFSANERKAAMNAASAYMDDIYGCRYLGTLPPTTADTQGLLWPREDVPNDRGGVYPGLGNEIPDVVHEACAEFAIAYLQNGNQSLYPAVQADGRSVSMSRKRVEGAVEIETQFDGGAAQASTRSYPKANAKIRQVITPSSRLLLRA